MKSKEIAIIISLVLLCTSIYAQPKLNWNINYGDFNTQISSIKSSETTTYITGKFADSLKLDAIKLKSNGQDDIFLVALSNSGTPEWGISIGGNTNDRPAQLALIENSIIVSGLHNNLKKIDDEKQIEEQSLFFASYDSVGKQQWKVNLPFKGRAKIDVLETWKDSLILICGSIKGEIIVNNKSYFFNANESAYSLVFTNTGKFISCNFSNGTGNHRNTAAHFDDYGFIYILTSISPGSYSVNSYDKNDYIAKSNALILNKFNSSLNQQWMQPIACDEYIEGVELQSDFSGNIYSCINFSNTIKAQGVNANSDSKLASIIIKCDPDGRLLWAQTLKSPDYCRLMDFILTEENSLLLTGYYSNGLNIMQENANNQNSGQNAFLLQLNNNGKFEWCENIKSEYYNFSKSISFDNDGSVYFAGGSLGSHEEHNNTKSKDIGAFINKYKICKDNYIKIQANPNFICDGDSIEVYAPDGFSKYIWNDSIYGNQKFIATEEGLFTLTVIDADGCSSNDSINILNGKLTELNLGNDTILFPGEQLQFVVYDNFTNFYWNDNYLDRNRVVKYNRNLDDLTLVLFAQEDGYCMSADTITILFDELMSNDGFQLFPNPVKETLWWSSTNDVNGDVIVELFDARKVLLDRQKLNEIIGGMQYSIQMDGYVPGTYYLRIKSKDNIIYKQFIKQ